MNPAALLNPRGFQQPQQRFESGFTNTPPAQPLAFQFDSPAGSYQQPVHAHPPPQQNINGAQRSSAYANGGGMGHMLERSMVPQKRQKIHDERPENARKAEFHGGGKGGVLGEYVREKREEGQKENVVSRTAVDLSTGLYLHLVKRQELTAV
jgi:hypothetical protein